ncbi:hypothetical protein [Robertkochia aurantiaca]|uniref:hypothetical protein n=1 Tax=Robertkochia aurantiaca TaxID=2873700 RepID=UPI001CCFC70D|nr:hypothetical protein [Robertkochia sp. 3YJGBD-33]
MQVKLKKCSGGLLPLHFLSFNYMKNITLIIVIFCCLPVFLVGQTYAEKSEVIEDARSIDRSVQLNLVSNQNSTSPARTISNNNIFIKQIGINNTATVANVSNSSKIEIEQNGNKNEAGLYLQAERIQYRLQQLGDDHKYLHFNNSNPELINVNAIQNGNGTDIIIHGKNSLSEKLKINMNGNARSLIIRNFN